MRVNNTGGPTHATIVDAYIQFQVGGENSELTDLTIYGKTVHNADIFVNSSSNI